MVARSHGVSDPRWSPDGSRLGWIDGFDGRSDLVVAPADGSTPPVVVTADCPVGGGWCWAGPDEVVVAARDGRLLALSIAGGRAARPEPRRPTRPRRRCRRAARSRSRSSVTMRKTSRSFRSTVPSGRCGCRTPTSRGTRRGRPTAATLAWHEWDLPDMPWDASRIAIRSDDGAVKTIGGDAVAVGQPRFSPDGSQLAYISRRRPAGPCCTVADADGANAKPVLAEHREHAEPAWGPGQRSFAWSPDGRELAWCRNEDGFGRLVIAAPGSRSARELSRGWHRGLDWGARRHPVRAFRRGHAAAGRRRSPPTVPAGGRSRAARSAVSRRPAWSSRRR